MYTNGINFHCILSVTEIHVDQNECCYYVPLLFCITANTTNNSNSTVFEAFLPTVLSSDYNVQD